MADTRDFLPKADPPLAEKSAMSKRFIEVEAVDCRQGAYVLLGDQGKYMYKGSARDLKKRIADHLAGRVTRTRNRRPLEILHIEYTVDYTEARQRENWLKSGQGRKWLKEQYAWVVKWQTQGT